MGKYVAWPESCQVLQNSDAFYGMSTVKPKPFSGYSDGRLCLVLVYLPVFVPVADAEDLLRQVVPY